MSDKNDFMPMGMPPVMVDFEDMQQFMAQDERIKEIEKELQKVKQERGEAVELLMEMYEQGAWAGKNDFMGDSYHEALLNIKTFLNKIGDV